MGKVEPFWVAGRPATGSTNFEVRHPWDGRPIATVSQPDAGQVDAAVAAAVGAAQALSAMSVHGRAAALTHVSGRIAERGEEIAALITAESGKPLTWARAEVARATSTFRWGAEEARRWSGQLQRLDTDPAGVGRLAMVRRVPRGAVLGITPFNFPLNLVAHKVAPALAVGAPVIIKPAPKTPLSSLLLAELLAETDLPEGSWSVLTVPNEAMADLVADSRLPVVSFTGSAAVGWTIRDAVPRKHVVLELGGNAAVLVAADWSSSQDLRWAAQRIATFSNYQAGQSCIAVQRVYAERGVYEELLGEVTAAVERLRTGDPADEATEVGPLIDLAAAERVERWIAEAVDAGATVVTGGKRDGTSITPTVLRGVPSEARVVREEAFGPVLVIEPVDGLDDGLARINDSPYGLQAGVFTHDVTTAFHAYRQLDVGGVIIGDVPSYRADQMPYGGVKESGVGREGVRAAMDDLTVERVLVLTGIDL
ncbi:aldehyde dehydrogenase family protein [Candidatus Protofrankia californiensis]|uniref:aldehyde dehydrogenase family protein n=1 Tax=Candidatus Protofrankia californiensis TaxID=1839754 RepID=UPI001041059F|nr:aldehyde dehydrogenase family protein [Candidatus Protofrankia californiensis]